LYLADKFVSSGQDYHSITGDRALGGPKQDVVAAKAPHCRPRKLQMPAVIFPPAWPKKRTFSVLCRETCARCARVLLNFAKRGDTQH
jgi:hypothetical protein